MYKSLHEKMFFLLFNKYLEMNYLDYIVGMCLTFEETIKLFSNWLYHFTFSPARYDNEFSDSSSMLCQSLILLAIRIGVSHCYFNLHFLNDEWHWAFFMCLFPIHTSSLVKCLFWTQVHYQIYFLQSVAYLFILLTVFLKDQKFLTLMNFNLGIFFLLQIILIIWYLKTLCIIQGQIWPK